MTIPKAVFILLFFALKISAQNKFTVSGYVKEKGSKELLPGANIYFPAIKQGTSTNNYGFYSITLPGQDSLQVPITYVGYQPYAATISVRNNVELTVELKPAAQIKEAVVEADHVEQVSQSSRMSVIEIPVSQIKNIPSLMGEKDVLRTIQLMPGVQKGGEGNSGLYVRGGGADQNLIILDDAMVYNAYHLFGFFSLFNGDALKSVELTKGGFPARYGGRLSSVIDMTMKDGNKQEVHGEGGIGLISSRFTIEGPIKKNKSSFLFSGRRTYIDILSIPFQLAENDGDGYGGYFFYDFNAKANWDIDAKNKLLVSGYFGKDKFYGRYNDPGEQSKFGLQWGNATATARWNHLINEKTFTNASFIFSNYRFMIREDDEFNGETYSLRYYSGVRDFSLKYDVDYRPGNMHAIRMGLISTYHYFTPRASVFNDSQNNISQNDKTHYTSFENALYIEDDFHPVEKLRINAGIRLSHFLSDDKNYLHPEPRIAVAYNIRRTLAVKASYAEMNQYLHQLSNSGIGLPTDLWVPATNRIAPQQSKQVAAGIAKDFLKKDIAITLEGYYKTMNNVLAYSEGATFVDVGDPYDPNYSYTDWQDKVTSGRGTSYGAELLIQKKAGRFNGWIGYTLSWTQLQFDSLNRGKKFYAHYDRRHDISVVGIYNVREPTKERGGIRLSATWVYGTGNAITLPIGTFMAPSHQPGSASQSYQQYGYYSATDYTSRNAFRMAPYHRLDFGIQFIRQRKKYIRTWDLSIYNVYNRHNPYFYYIESEDKRVQKNVLMQFSLFPVLPSISYNFKF